MTTPDYSLATPPASQETTTAAPTPTPKVIENGVLDRMNRLTFPQGPKVDQLFAMLNQLILVVDDMFAEQNAKITRLAEICADKASRKMVEELGTKFDDLIVELRQRLEHTHHHHDDHSHTPEPKTIQQLVEEGRATIDSSLECTDHALVMCVLRDGGLFLYDITRDENGLPQYKPFDTESDASQLGTAVLEEHRSKQYKPGQLVYITVNLITDKPLDETSVQVPVKTQS